MPLPALHPRRSRSSEMGHVVREFVEQISRPQADQQSRRFRPGAEHAQGEQKQQRAQGRARREADEDRTHRLRGCVMHPVSAVEKGAHSRRSRPCVQSSMNGVLQKGPKQQARQTEPQQRRPRRGIARQRSSAERRSRSEVEEEGFEVHTTHAKPFASSVADGSRCLGHVATPCRIHTRVAEARGNRTHRRQLSLSPTGFEARGSHQTPFASASGGPTCLIARTRAHCRASSSAEARGERLDVRTPISPRNA